jgi:hypothetical protein
VTLRGPTQVSAARVFGCYEPKAHAKQGGRAHPSSRAKWMLILSSKFLMLKEK